jgi:hypothetical protein
MEAILARRFSPFNFFVVPGFPNIVPTIDEWGDYLPRFRENKDDNPADHLLDFHEVMHQLGIHHEDVLMKMFMYSLEGYAREWYRSFPSASISSLEQFHVAFNDHCKRFFPADLLCENCCEEFQSYIQQSIISSSSSIDEGDDNVEEEKEDSLSVVSSSNSVIQHDDFQHSFKTENDDEKAINVDVKSLVSLDFQQNVFQLCVPDAANDSHDCDRFVAQIFHEYLAPVCDIFEVEQTPFISYEEELPNPHFKSSFIVDMDLHSPEIVEQQEIYKSENDLLEQERKKNQSCRRHTLSVRTTR